MRVDKNRDPLPEIYRFGTFTLDVADRQLTCSGAQVKLAPKTLELLVVLVRRGGRLTTKRELLEAVWPDVFVEEGILAVHVATLRKALNDAKQSPRYIETVSRSGYRFVAAVTRVADEDPEDPAGVVCVAL